MEDHMKQELKGLNPQSKKEYMMLKTILPQTQQKHVRIGENGQTLSPLTTAARIENTVDFESVRKAHFNITRKKKLQNFGLTWVEKTIKKFQHDTADGWLLRLSFQRKNIKSQSSNNFIKDDEILDFTEKANTPQHIESRLRKRSFHKKIVQLKQREDKALEMILHQKKIMNITQKCDRENKDIQRLLTNKIKKYEEEQLTEQIQSFWNKYRTMDVQSALNKFNV
ncbi:UNKNOWN [Stylonychia lemnae]|uniref:Uncharacterized protein n=1 Tax=Stylonychia lemnae TaxID=5949 RepID=A0A078B096_STYLE|nr:UNKNOWN [Stylonychia lemnae]|eukprot:CDW86508.1 UNKNOWN [Stylonychia lemnae]